MSFAHALARLKTMTGGSIYFTLESHSQEPPMNIEIHDTSLEARIQKQIQATGAASAEEALLRLLETQEEQYRWLLGENSRKGNLRTLRLGLLYSAGSAWPKTSRGDSFVGVPNVVCRQINMLPAQRRQMF